MRKIRTNKGFTLVEALFVVAIIVVLSSVIIMSIVDHMRSLEKTENDGYAKTIFVAAQNHLTMAAHEGYLGRTYFGLKDSEDEDNGIYYFRVDNQTSDVSVERSKSVLDLMLPFGSLDDTVRAGSYIVRYQKSSAKVLDVFYWKTDGRYAFDYTEGDYQELLNTRTTDPDSLRNFRGAVIGYYGGAEADLEPGEKLDAPQIQVINAERLYVLIDQPIRNTDEKINLAVRGETSGNLKQLTLSFEGDAHWNGSNYEVTLDDITTGEPVKNRHFNNINSTTNSDPWVGGSLIPGENITIYAVAYSSVYTNVAYSSEQTTNSLFAEGNKVDGALPDTVKISNIRHLENLDPTISGFGVAENATVNAIQTSDLDWDAFTRAIADAAEGDHNEEGVLVYNQALVSSNTGDGGFEPMDLNYQLNYDGQDHIIANVKMSTNREAGLFGAPTDAAVINFSNVMLQDFCVSGKSAGTLASNLKGGSIKNVVACQTKEAVAEAQTKAREDGVDVNTLLGVTATSGNAGGLVATTNGTNLEACAAAVYVNSTPSGEGSSSGHAGGLIGQAVNGSILGCYSAGITEGGDYYDNRDTATPVAIYSVKSNAYAGGLVGDCSATIEKSYSTCSVSGHLAGGLVGNASANIKDSYCTGLVQTNSLDGAAGSFAGELSGFITCSGISYFRIINWQSGIGEVGKLGPDVTISIAPFDLNTASYRAFVTTDLTNNAMPYDDTLTAYYQGRFNLQTVKQLGYSSVVSGEITDDESQPAHTDFVETHYGDWPAPETLIVNVLTGSTPVTPEPTEPTPDEPNPEAPSGEEPSPDSPSSVEPSP
ncbi:MAG: type II secretion system protein [Oscillospiraceae bacterium]|nr:type II secretion system protein [Oscillospiraceae bacterium]